MLTNRLKDIPNSGPRPSYGYERTKIEGLGNLDRDSIFVPRVASSLVESSRALCFRPYRKRNALNYLLRSDQDLVRLVYSSHDCRLLRNDLRGKAKRILSQIILTLLRLLAARRSNVLSVDYRLFLRHRRGIPFDLFTIRGANEISGIDQETWIVRDHTIARETTENYTLAASLSRWGRANLAPTEWAGNLGKMSG